MNEELSIEPKRSSLDSHDHRRLGFDLDLFHLQEEAPGAVFWHPRGVRVLRVLEEHVRRAIALDGYEEVRSPFAIARPIWESSGHWQAFAHGMFRAGDPEDDLALKPVNCPAHIQIVLRKRPSWRDLPLRISELGIVHRNEPRGVLAGLFRLRQFQQDDGHVFCREDQIEAEIDRFFARVLPIYRGFGLSDVEAAVSLRPKVRFGEDAVWDRAEAALQQGAARVGLSCVIQPGEGAFYGPKIELALRDRIGRSWQCGTLQLDLVMPSRFDLAYVDKDGAKKPMAMIHRAMLGSFERFLGILLEHYRGRLPGWLAPEQVRVIPVSSAHVAWANEAARGLRAAGLRAEVDDDDGSLPSRVALARAAKIPFVAVAGNKEVEARALAVRDLAIGDRGTFVSLDDAARALVEACAPPPV